jgi:ectoine hydroxylase-related dioxygenase (phytanoyl-CoA dioxygenase family)
MPPDTVVAQAQPIDAGTRAAFEADGAVPLRGVVGSAWLGRLAAAIERDIAKPGPFAHGYVPENGQGRFHGNLKLWESDADCRAFCLGSGLPALAAALLGAGRVNLFYDQLFVKEPGTVNRTRWHNDLPYWPIRGRQVLSFWLALDPTTRDSGALEFVRGSHRWGRWFQPERFGDTKAHGDYERNPDYEQMPDLEAARGDYDIVSWNLAPGDIVAFHGLTVHGAGGNNRTDVRRRGYAVRYSGDDVVYDTRPGPNANLRVAGMADGAPLAGPNFPEVWRRRN